MRGVFLTHIHYDHIYGLNKLAKAIDGFSAYINQIGQKALMDSLENLSFFYDDPFTFAYPERLILVEDNQLLQLSSGKNIQAVYTPGHSETCITWITDDYVFSGDSYIPGVRTVSKLPGGDPLKVIDSEHKILTLAKDKYIYPGHSIHIPVLHDYY